MARKAKPPASTPVFSAAKWAPLSEAFARAKVALGSGALAEVDLTKQLRSGGLTTAWYFRGALEPLEPTFWKSLQVVEVEYLGCPPSILVLGIADGIAPSGPFFADGVATSEHFFVARAALNKLYSTHPTPSGAPTRRKPGPQPEAKPRPATGKRKAGAKGNPWWPDLIRHLEARFPRRPHPDSDVSFNAAKDWLVDNKKALPAESTIRDGLRKRLPTWPRDSRRA